MNHPNHGKSVYSSSLYLSVIGLVILSALSVQSETVHFWDFSEELHGWKGNGRVAGLKSTNEGMDFESTGLDPWVEGPAERYPRDVELLLTIRMRVEADSSAEVFYGGTFTADKSVRFSTNADGQWREYTLKLPALGPVSRLRLDPCNNEGPHHRGVDARGDARSGRSARLCNSAASRGQETPPFRH